MHERILLESNTKVEQAGRWLERFIATRSLELSRNDLCVAFLGISCAIRALGNGSAAKDFLDVAQRLVTTLLERCTFFQERSANDLIDDPVTWLLSAVYAAPDSAETNAYRRMVQEKWHALEGQGTSTTSLHLTSTCKLLSMLLKGESELGDISFPSASAFVRPFSYYLADTVEIQEALTTLTILTVFGRRAPQLAEPELEFVQKALPFWTFYFIKERDLDNVCPLARTLKHLGLEALPEFTEAIRYILRQSREDGSFGIYDMSYKYTSSEPVDVERQVRLPLTVGSLWTLLECLHDSGSPLHHPSAYSHAIGEH